MKNIINIIGISFLGIVLCYFCLMSFSFILFGSSTENDSNNIMYYYWAITVITGLFFAFWLKKLKAHNTGNRGKRH